MNLWEAIPIEQPGILACTGAGGKTSLLQTLAKEGSSCYFPVILSTTTKMFFHQIEKFMPIISNDYEIGASRIAAQLATGTSAAWVNSREGDKCLGVPALWLDRLAAANPSSQLLVEADGARSRLIKAPAAYEPVIPFSTTITAGVLNLQALGQPLDERVAHRPELISSLLNKSLGEKLEALDFAAIALHEQGIFKTSRGRKVFLLTGADAASPDQIAAIIQGLRRKPADIYRCILTEGYGENMRPLEVYDL